MNNYCDVLTCPNRVPEYARMMVKSTTNSNDATARLITQKSQSLLVARSIYCSLTRSFLSSPSAYERSRVQLAHMPSTPFSQPIRRQNCLTWPCRLSPTSLNWLESVKPPTLSAEEPNHIGSPQFSQLVPTQGNPHRRLCLLMCQERDGVGRIVWFYDENSTGSVAVGYVRKR